MTYPEHGYYAQGCHLYYVHKDGITHVNIATKLINQLDVLYLASYEQLTSVTQEAFEDGLRKVIFDLNLFAYTVSLPEKGEKEG